MTHETARTPAEHLKTPPAPDLGPSRGIPAGSEPPTLTARAPEQRKCQGVPSPTQPRYPRRECTGCEHYEWAADGEPLGHNERGRLVCDAWEVRL